MLDSIYLLLLVSAQVATGSSAGNPMMVDVCTLLTHPENYVNQHVTVRARLYTGFELVAIGDKKCVDAKGNHFIWLAFMDDDVARYRPGTFAEFLAAASVKDTNSADGRWLEPSSVEIVSTPEAKAFWKTVKDGDTPTITVVGRFDHDDSGRLTYTKAGDLGFGGGFGHLNGYTSRIVVEHISRKGK